MISAILEQLGVLFDALVVVSRVQLDFVKALAWPVAVTMLALVYRQPLIDLLYRFRKGKFMGVELETEARETVIDAQVAGLTETVRQLREQTTALLGSPQSLGAASGVPESPERSADAETERAVQEKLDAESDAMAKAVALDISRSAEMEVAREAAEAEAELEASRMRLLEARQRNRDLSDSILDEDPSRWSASQLMRMGSDSIGVYRISVENAWTRLRDTALLIGPEIGLRASESSLEEVVRRLSHRGIIAAGTARVANRLTRLRKAIAENSETLSAESAEDFVVASQELLSVLSQVEQKLRLRPSIGGDA